ncbi:MAG: hypothetical protein JXA90_02535 [Planctomycetes bacterium]|nr:hypothetical protein [Planctomycetota bacterium]
MDPTHCPAFRLLRAASLFSLAAALFLCGAPAFGQIKSPAERIDELEAKVAKMEKKLKSVPDEKEIETIVEDSYSKGTLTFGGAELRFGGQLEILLIDAEDDLFAPLGADGGTEEPDPHIEIQRLRLEPELELNRWINVVAQLDFEPTEGDTLLKEVYIRYDLEPEDWWWFASRLQLGLDDRFIRPSRRTKGYPLIGNAFWRDESIAFTWALTFGDKDGKPLVAGQRGGGASRVAEEGLESDDGGPAASGHGAFDFVNNWGALRLYLSVGQGYALDSNEVSREGSRFNDLIQDNRELENDLSLRELGIGLEYSRSFAELGELSLLGFYYNDELRDQSIEYLQQEVTLRGITPEGLPTVEAGYGDSSSHKSYRYGAGVEYFLPAASLVGDLFEVRNADGLRVLAQYIKGVDGELERDGWFVQGSYRFSFGRLVQDRYFRSLEPLVRYGVLDVDLADDPRLPETWDRRELVLGAILEVTGDLFFKVEYSFHDESTGSPRTVDNDELLVELLAQF